MSYYSTVPLVALTALCWLLMATVAPEGGGLTGALAPLTYFMTAMAGASVVEMLLMGLLQRGSQSERTTDLFRGLTSLVLYGVALLLWLRYALGFDITNLLATSAVVTVVVGLALQSTLVSLFSGLSLELEHPLRVGDYLRMGETEGRVEALRWRSILLKTAENTSIVVPNVLLTTHAFEVYRRDAPARMAARFLVPASTPPGKVMAIALDVLKSDIPSILHDPSPNVVLIGPESENESLRYALRYYSLAYLHRSTLNSNLLTRLWYAFSREGIEMRADCVGVQVVDNAIAAPSRSRPPTALPHSVPACLATSGLRLFFGPGEVIPSDLAGFVVAGSAREAMRPDEMDVSARIADLLTRPAPSAARYLIADEELARISAQAAGYIGPVANAIAERCARLVGDPYLVYHALAQSIPDGEQRRRFLIEAPACPMRKMGPGTPFGWAAMLGFETGDPPRRAVDAEVELLILRRPDLIALLQNGGVVELAGAISSEPGLAGIERASLIERLAIAAKD
jgi:small-conductance mechanosensitive channel